jgi:hypothetical protein
MYGNAPVFSRRFPAYLLPGTMNKSKNAWIPYRKLGSTAGRQTIPLFFATVIDALQMNHSGA